MVTREEPIHVIYCQGNSQRTVIVERLHLRKQHNATSVRLNSCEEVSRIGKLLFTDILSEDFDTVLRRTT